MTSRILSTLSIFLLALTTALAACGEAVSSWSTPSSTFTFHSTKSQPPKITFIHSATPVRSYTPSGTNPWPSWTPRFSPTPTLTLDPTRISLLTTSTSLFHTQEAEILSTQNAGSALRDIFRNGCIDDLDANILLSPDGLLLAIDCQRNGGMVILQVGGGKVATVTYGEIFSDTNPVLIDGEIIPLHWEGKNQYLYFSRRDTRLSGPGLDNYSDNLYRLDINTGKWNLIAIGSLDYYHFSPSGKKLLIIDEYLEPLNIQVFDLRTGNPIKMQVNGFLEGAHALWSPNEGYFVFTASTRDNDEIWGEFAVWLCDLGAATCQRITGITNDFLSPETWSPDNVVDILLTHFDVRDGTLTSRILSIDLVAGFYILPTP